MRITGVLAKAKNWSNHYSNLPESYIKRATDQVYWKNPKGPQYKPNAEIKRKRFKYTEDRSWTLQFQQENAAGRCHAKVWVEPVKEWSYFRGDRVEILEGKDKGKQGYVTSIIQERNWVIIEGLNCKLEKLGTQKEPVYMQKEQPLLVTTQVVLVDPSDLKPTKFEWRYTEEGQKVRVSTRTGRIIPIPASNDETRDYKSKASYKEQPKDTLSAEVDKISFEPALCTFEMDIMEKMGIKEERIPPKSYCAPYPDDQESLESREVKIEDVDILEQFISENGVYDRNENIIKTEIGTNGLPEQFQEKEGTHGQEYSVEEADSSSSKLRELKCTSCNAAVQIAQKVTPQLPIDSVNLNFSLKHKCDLCDYATNLKTDLKKHIAAAHSKKQKCKYCSYSSDGKYILKRHIESVHLNLKHHKCNFCDYSTARRGILRQHTESVHLKLKQHKCNLCNYAAYNKFHLKMHNDCVHVNMKQYKCSLCDFASNMKHLLRKHANSLHPKLNKNECNFCDYTIDCKYILKTHIDSAHLNPS